MKKVQIERSDLLVSQICLGGQQFGTRLSEKESFEILDRYEMLGGNFLDAEKNVCHLDAVSRSEELIGKWMRQRKHNDILIATRGRLRADDEIESQLEQEVDKGRKRLQKETIDLYWISSENENVRIRELVDCLESLVLQGKIRYYGFSNFPTKALREAKEYIDSTGKIGFVAVSNQWSLASKRSEILSKEREEGMVITTTYEQYCWHKETQIPLMPFTSTAEDFFSKMYQDGRRINWDRSDGRKSTDAIYWTDRNLMIYNDLLKINKEKGISFTTMSIAYLVNQSFPVFPICNANSVEQLEEMISGCEVVIPEDILQKWKSISW